MNAYFCICLDTLGWSPDRPANSCKHILDSGDHKGDGTKEVGSTGSILSRLGILLKSIVT